MEAAQTGCNSGDSGALPAVVSQDCAAQVHDTDRTDDGIEQRHRSIVRPHTPSFTSEVGQAHAGVSAHLLCAVGVVDGLKGALLPLNGTPIQCETQSVFKEEGSRTPATVASAGPDPATVTWNQSSSQQGSPVSHALPSVSDRVGPTQHAPGPRFSEVSLEQLRFAQQEFAAERDWDKFHSPRNLLLALVGEVGELSEIFQWKGEVSRELPEFTSEEKTHLGEELSDCLLYLIRLADVCGVDLASAALTKIQKNGRKYPAQHCRGSSAKYTAYAAVNERPHDTPSENTSKRKRFTEDQVEALTTLAENSNWSLSALTQRERDQICEQFGLSRDRLQNFFNNRKPKVMKKSRGRQDSGPLELITHSSPTPSLGQLQQPST